MTRPLARQGSLTLVALDGSNPLGFLAALGTLVAARQAGEIYSVLRWKRDLAWIPVLEGLSIGDPIRFSELLADALRGARVSEEAENARKEAQRAFDAAKKVVEEHRKTIGRRRLKGQERKTAIDQEIRPLERVRDGKRDEWLRALAQAASRPELVLGKHIDCTAEELRAHASALLASADPDGREPLDFLAAFASDACIRDSGRVDATPFCFVTGSGHQYFLDTVRQLMELVEPKRVQRALFERWTYQDEKLSLRWDPAEDRRYALAAEDPSGESSRTVWMANLLAYRALVLFPSAPRRGRLATTAWSTRDGDRAFTWPIWEPPADPETIRSLLQLPVLAEPAPDRSILRARGIAATFRARRIKVGEGANYKLNFSPAHAL
ncbi:MAG: hypothetical protein ABR583_05425 [Gaiellaceae bacterium]